MVLHSLEAFAGVAAMFALAVAGLTLTIYGLRHDIRERRRSYRRRGPPPPRAGGPPEQPAKG